MSNIVNKKFNALNNIYNSYENYKGGYKSRLENQISELKNKLTNTEYIKLLENFQDFKDYIFNIFASTQRVFIKLTSEEQQTNFENLDNLFEDFEN